MLKEPALERFIGNTRERLRGFPDISTVSGFQQTCATGKSKTICTSIFSKYCMTGPCSGRASRIAGATRELICFC